MTHSRDGGLHHVDAQLSARRQVSNGISSPAVEDLTGLVESRQLRRYSSYFCNENYTLPQLTQVFAAHAVEWSLMGKLSPWHSVLTTLPHGAEYNDSQKLQFYQSGAEHVDEVIHELETSDLLPSSGQHYALRSMAVLDFGCGLGRLSFSFASLVRRVVCIDQSVTHLRRAQSETLRLNFTTASKISFTTASPDLLAALRGERSRLTHAHQTLRTFDTPIACTRAECARPVVPLLFHCER